MIVEAVVVERNNSLQVYSPRLSKGLPIHHLKLKHKGKKVKLASSMTEVESDNVSCKCDSLKCDNNVVTRETLRKIKLIRGSRLTCKCCDTIYIIVPEVFLK